jgi:PLP dependent protein
MSAGVEQAALADVGQRLAAVRAEIEAAAREAGREPSTVTLVAASKAQSLARIEAALAAGQRVFGENYVQEAAGRWAGLRERHPDIELHMIGGLQSNKAREAVALFDCIQTLDRPRLARGIAREIERQGRRPRLLVQVNTGEEPQKSGVLPDGLPALLDLCREELALELEGLMAVPPEDEDIAMHTALLVELARRHGLRTVSAGMSHDFAVAIRFGATCVRIGSAIFGPRPKGGASG